jgi:hypothetical membrane protein
VSAGTAPVVLVGGWTLAAARQPRGYDPIRDTISALAAQGATDRWIMTAALAALGLCHLTTAAGLRPARVAGRIVLALGGGATLGVAAFPQPIRGESVGHTVTATIAFAALALWGLCAASSKADSLALAPRVAVVAALVLAGLVLWFVFELHGGHRGLAERVAAGAEALWPLAVVLTSVRSPRVLRPSPTGLPVGTT